MIPRASKFYELQSYQLELFNTPASRISGGKGGLLANKEDLQKWVLTALKSLNGSGGIVDVARVIWRDHETELRSSGDLFFTWQYDMRWAANQLRRKRIMKSVDVSPRGTWEIE